MSSAAEGLIDHALALRWSSVSETDRAAARIFLHDTLCVGAAGARAMHADAVLAIARGWGEGAQAGVLGRPSVMLPATAAAFVNAFQIHGQEYDCVHEPAVLHPMATVLAVLLAELARGEAVSGEQLLTAIIAGVDVAVALGLAATGPLTFFRPATAGIFGSVAAVANLRAIPRRSALDAFGHALAFASGTMQAHVEGKPALPLQVANAARNALVAVDLARFGIPGVRRPIEGPFGYFALLEVEYDIARALDQLGKVHRIAEVSWKPFPTGRAGHGGIVALQRLMHEHGVTAANVTALDYRAPPLIARLVGRPAWVGMEPGYARLCLPYLAAVTIAGGTVGLSDFGAARLNDPGLLEFASRVTVTDDGNPDPAAFVPAVATARLTDGHQAQVAVTALLGSPSFPLTREQHLAKAKDCLSFVGLAECHARLIDAIETLDQTPNALALLRSTGVLN